MERDKFIDLLKGMACLLVVIGHVLSGTADKLNQTTGFYYLQEFIGSFHMALFMMASGYIYRYTNSLEKSGNYWKFILKKFINLGIPYFVFSILYIFINMFAGDNVNTSFNFKTILTLYMTPIAQYWFLYALFFIFVIVGVLDTLIKNKKIVLLITFILKLSSIWINYGILVYAISMIFYFYIGTFFVGKLENKIFKKYFVILIYPILTIFFIYLKNKYNLSKVMIELIKIPLSLSGIYFAIVLLNLINSKTKKLKECLLYIYEYSFQIYLLHIFFTASFRTVLIKLSIDNYIIHFVAGILIGIIGSIICAKISNNIIYTNLVFFPQKTLRKLKEERGNKDYENCNDRT